jgi:hypothetical protein
MKPKANAPAPDILRRIRSEFSEMPGLKLTTAQAQRLWAIDPPTCERVINTLIGSGFLVRTRDGSVIAPEGQGTARRDPPEKGATASRGRGEARGRGDE